MTEQDLKDVIAKEPRLSTQGIGWGLQWREAKKLTPEAQKEWFAKGQQQLFERLDVISKVVEVMSPVEKTKHIVRKNRSGSYYLKHVVEDILGEYVSNAELIAACIHLGFNHKPASLLDDNPTNPNAVFNMSSKSIKALATKREEARKQHRNQ